ncbi:MAG: DUF5694 domain-containing protein [Gemmatimonadaceae bacterium]
MALALVAPAAAQEPSATNSVSAEAKRPHIMVVGTYHMANPGRDALNAGADDVLAPKRQAEIERLVDQLAAFRPTRVALEYAPSLDSVMNQRYADFRADRHSLNRNESEQVGFRLAARMGHPRVFGVDHPLDLDIGGVMQFAMANGQQRFAAETQQTMQRVMAEQARQMATLSVSEILAEHNGPFMAGAHAFYLRAARVGADTNYVGARMTSRWYERNLHIFANVGRLVSGPDERLLVLIGSGHGQLLREFILGAGEWELVDPLPFLRR